MEHQVAVVDDVASAVEVVPSSSSEEAVGHTDQVLLELRPVAKELQNKQDSRSYLLMNIIKDIVVMIGTCC